MHLMEMAQLTATDMLRTSSKEAVASASPALAASWRFVGRTWEAGQDTVQLMQRPAAGPAEHDAMLGGGRGCRALHTVSGNGAAQPPCLRQHVEQRTGLYTPASV